MSVWIWVCHWVRFCVICWRAGPRRGQGRGRAEEIRKPAVVGTAQPPTTAQVQAAAPAETVACCWRRLDHSDTMERESTNSHVVVVVLLNSQAAKANHGNSGDDRLVASLHSHARTLARCLSACVARVVGQVTELRPRLRWAAGPPSHNRQPRCMRGVRACLSPLGCQKGGHRGGPGSGSF